MKVKEINNFKIVYGANQTDLEEQVQALQKEGFQLHGSMVTQANPAFYANPTGSSSPFIYYQMLAKRTASPKLETDHDHPQE